MRNNPKDHVRGRGRGGKGGRGRRGGQDSVSPPQDSGRAPSSRKRQLQHRAGGDPGTVNVLQHAPPLVGTSVKLEVGEGKWFAVEVPALASQRMLRPEEDAVVGERRAQAEDAYRRFEAADAKQQNSDSAWLKSMMGSGTLSDRVAAMTLYFQQNPLTRLRVLDALLGMCEKKGRREAQMAVEAVKDLFQNDLLPERKLRAFRAQPLGSPDVRAAHLLLWRFEEEVKQRYLRFVGALEQGSQDTMAYFRQVCLRCTAELLQARPEQEQVLLALLANKLGDRDRKVASKAAFLLNGVVEKHPAMKGVVVREIEQLLARPNLSERAQYYAVTFLNQIMLTHAESEVARRLLALYFAHFERRVDAARGGGGGGGGGGVGDDDDARTARTGATGGVVDAASVASAGTAATGATRATFAARLSRREYREAVAARLLSALLTGVHRALPFAGVEASVLEQQADALFRVVFHAPLGAAVQALMLLFQVAAAQQGVADRFYRALYAKLLSPDVRGTSKLTMFLNLTFRALKHDPVPGRARASLKRLLQVAALSSPPFACAVLVLAGAIFAARPELRGALRDAEAAPAPAPAPADGGDAKAPAVDGYDPAKRDPRYAGADGACAWELTLMLTHYHPSVRRMAEGMLASEDGAVRYEGDPLRDFTLVAFLDRFAYRNPKAGDVARAKGRGRMARTAKHALSSAKRGFAAVEEPVNTDAFRRRARAHVRPEEEFFHKYFVEKRRRDVAAGRAKDGPEGEDAALAREEDALDGGGDVPEGAFDSDPELEAYATELAESLMQGEAHRDDEDVDFSMSSSDEEGEGEGEGEDGDVVFEDVGGPAAAAKGAARRAPRGGRRDEDEEALFGDDEEDEEDGGEGEGWDDLFVGMGGEDGEEDSDEEGSGGALGGALGGGDSDEEDGGGRARKRKRKAGPTFVDADEFAAMLESAGKEEAHPEQTKWEERGRRGRGGGRGGGRGRRGRGGGRGGRKRGRA